MWGILNCMGVVLLGFLGWIFAVASAAMLVGLCMPRANMSLHSRSMPLPVIDEEELVGSEPEAPEKGCCRRSPLLTFVMEFVDAGRRTSILMCVGCGVIAILFFAITGNLAATGLCTSRHLRGEALAK